MIWQQCQGAEHITDLEGTLYRLVESQILATSMSFVDDLDEQFLLEQMLDETKPAYPPNSQNLHYLLKTPFRYPPLDWGSRFGRKHEPSLFYGGKDPDTVLAESAYYRLVFWHSMEGAPCKDRINTEHCLFSVNYQTDIGINLTSLPFSQYKHQLTHISDYQSSQALGSEMRQANIQAFEYFSARCDGICIALYTPQPFTQQKPLDSSQWLCQVTAEQVSFKRTDGDKVHKFPFELFTQDDVLPMPA